MQKLFVLVDGDTPLFLLVLLESLEVGLEQVVPESEERLSKIGLDTELLMMNIVIDSVVGEKPLEWIEWQSVPTVIIDGFHGGKSVKEHLFSMSQMGQHHGDTCS